MTPLKDTPVPSKVPPNALPTVSPTAPSQEKNEPDKNIENQQSSDSTNRPR